MNTSFDSIKYSHPDWNPAYPNKWPRPNIGVIKRIEAKYGVKYPKEYIDFQVKYCQEVPMGDAAWDGFGWANDELEPYLSLETIAHDFFSCAGDVSLAPFRCSNGDFECFDADAVVFWDHNQGKASPMISSANFLQWLAATFSG